MILIADSGSTKTDWCMVGPNGTIQNYQTQGTNPFFQSEEDINRVIETDLLPQLPSTDFDSVFFYGAGCIPSDKTLKIHQIIGQHLNIKKGIEINTDMLAAARSLCGRHPGIACIIGTGSNSCCYDGKQITQNISPLGYILGDEGSGAYLGKQLIGDLLKNQLGTELKEAFFEQFDLTPSDIIERVYRQPFPNRFLASFSPFLSEHIANPAIHTLILNAFKAFLRRNVMQYDTYKKYEIHFTGSVAFHYQNILHEATNALGIRLGKIRKSPMEGLIRFHTDND